MKRYLSQFKALYQKNGYIAIDQAMTQLKDVIEAAKQNRHQTLLDFDASQQGWYLAQDAIAYNLYVDLFSKSIKGLIKMKSPHVMTARIKKTPRNNMTHDGFTAVSSTGKRRANAVIYRP